MQGVKIQNLRKLQDFFNRTPDTYEISQLYGVNGNGVTPHDL